MKRPRVIMVHSSYDLVNETETLCVFPVSGWSNSNMMLPEPSGDPLSTSSPQTLLLQIHGL